MAYHLELYNNTNASRIGYFVNVKNVLAVIELEGEDRLSFTIDWDDKLFDSITVRDYVRIVNDSDSADYRSYIIQSIKTDKSGILNKQIDCEGLKYALMDNIIEGKKPYAQITMTTALTIALAGSGFTVGTVDAASSNLRDIEFDWPNSLEALQLCIDTWTYEDTGVTKKYFYDITEAKVVNVRAIENLKTVRYFYIHSDKNMNSIVKTINVDNMGNKIYAIGADGFSIYRANGTTYQYIESGGAADGGAAGYLECVSQFTVDDYHNTMNVYIFEGTGADQIRTISDTVASTGRIIPTVNFSPAPDGTSMFMTGVAINGTSCLYTLGNIDSNADCLAKGTQIRLRLYFSTYWDGGGSGDTCTFEVDINLKNNAGTTLIKGHASQIANWNTTGDGGPGTYVQEIIIDVGDFTTIKKIEVDLISDTTTGSGDAHAFVEMAQMEYILSDNLAYVQNAASIATYGTVIDKYENSNIVDTINLVNQPALDGIYSSGLCADWVKIGLPTLSENTDANYIRNGTKSQKIINNSSGDGIKTRVYLRSNIAYSAYILMYIDSTYSGAVTITLDSSSGEADTVVNVIGAGWIEVTIENFSYNFGGLYSNEAYIDLKITSNGTAQIWYVDSAQVAEGTEVKPFVKGDSADVLYAEAMAYLQFHKDPEVSYNIDMADLYEIDPVRYSDEAFDPGDQIRIVDRDLVIDSNIICIRKEFNPLDPGKCQLLLENRKLMFKNSILKAMTKLVRIRRPAGHGGK